MSYPAKRLRSPYRLLALPIELAAVICMWIYLPFGWFYGISAAITAVFFIAMLSGDTKRDPGPSIANILLLAIAVAVSPLVWLYFMACAWGDYANLISDLRHK
jgi:uncharacterized membrane protein YccC